MNILSLLSSFASLIFIFMGLYALKLEPRSRLNRIFFAITFCASLWSLSYAFIYSAASEESRLRFSGRASPCWPKNG